MLTLIVAGVLLPAAGTIAGCSDKSQPQDSMVVLRGSEPEEATKRPAVQQSQEPAPAERKVSSENQASKVQVLKSTIDWRPGYGNPEGPDLIWVTAHLKNNSPVPIGVVWAEVWIYDQSGNKIAGTDEEVIFYAEGRDPIAPGKSWKGDKDYEGENYLPMLDDLTILTEQPVKVEVKIIAAYEDKDTGPDGKVIF